MEKSGITSESSNDVMETPSGFKKHLVLEGMKITKLNDHTEEREHFFRYETPDLDKVFAATLLTEGVLHELGDGDGENGGTGSLKNCRGDIWNFLFHHGHYSYADFLFSIEEKTPFNYF